jgi:alginate O-acetyltransferase complex protein AlgI
LGGRTSAFSAVAFGDIERNRGAGPVELVDRGSEFGAVRLGEKPVLKKRWLLQKLRLTATQRLPQMLFNSYIFWVFLAVVILLNRLLPHRAQNRMLLIASNIFYASWDWRFLSLIWFSILVDYSAALLIQSADNPRRRKVILSLSICANLGVLGFFKYYGFFSREFAEVLNVFGLPVSMPLLNVILPVGISFYTFQSMSYTIDVYRRRTQPTKALLDYALYVFFFPQLVAGPIERSERLLPQMLNPRRKQEDFREGLYHITLGLFKKIVIADNMAPIVNTVFRGDLSQLSGTECLIGVYAFAFQIYGDFSGYSSIAQGVAKWLGFDLMTNFNHPYFARSPSEFWQRWHISLSSWLRDYLYIPLGGNRQGKWRTSLNLLIVMLLGGLWHGANWTFLAWGLFHGLLLCGYRLFGDSSKGQKQVLPFFSVIQMILMFHFVCFSWLLFRAESIAQAWSMMTLIATDWRVTEFTQFGLGTIAFYVCPLLLYELWLEKKQDLLALIRHRWETRAAVYSYCALMLLFFPAPIPNEFIYFQF